MRLVITLYLDPSPEQTTALVETVARFNAACSAVARTAFEHATFRQFDLHRLAYQETRRQFNLSADSTLRVIARVADAYKIRKETVAEFRAKAAVPYQTGDNREIRFRLSDRQIRITSTHGRLSISFRCPTKHLGQLKYLKGQAELVCRNGQWLLLCGVEVPEELPITVDGWLGVDLGIVNLVTTSVGQEFGGNQVEKVRRKSVRSRRTYQRRGTKSAKRRLKKLSGRQSRFQRNVNHVVSKAIVAKAKALRCGIVLEELKGISSERTVTQTLRQRLGNWGFFQLRRFIEYKAKLAGIPVWLVNPRNTSRTCFVCGHCDKANRRSQSEFVCRTCGFTASADQNAACNLARLGEQQSTSLIQSRTPVNSPAPATSRRR